MRLALTALFGSAATLVLAALTLSAAPEARSLEPPRQAEAASVNVMSFNIRFNNPRDSAHAWPHRKDHVASMIRFHQAEVAGLQEALIGQIRDLEERLPGYAWVGVGRKDGDEGGEFTPIFYRTERLDVLDHGTFWLSETPQVPGSQSWDAALPRIATWARFRDRRSGASFYHFNTHFDHRGERARQESARLLTRRVDSMATAEGPDAPVVVTGDFNVTPSSAPYAHLSDALVDARTSVEAPHGPPGTTAPDFEVDRDEGRRIDYIFTTGAAEASRFGTLTDQWNGDYPSDHLPVLAAIQTP